MYIIIILSKLLSLSLSPRSVIIILLLFTQPTACFLYQMMKIALTYGAVVSAHYLVVFVLLLAVYWRILHYIGEMRKKHG